MPAEAGQGSLCCLGCLLPELDEVQTFDGAMASGGSVTAGTDGDPSGGNGSAGSGNANGGNANAGSANVGGTKAGNANGGSANAGSVNGGTGNGGAAGDVATGGDPAAGAAGAGGEPYCETQVSTPLPLTLSEQFVPSGYLNTSHLEFAWKDEECVSRPSGAVGRCEVFEWLPETLEWVGVVWQHPANNWTEPGLCIAKGAQSVTLKARGNTNGIQATFSAAGAEAGGPSQLLTTAWQTFVIDLSGIDYNGYNPAGGVNTGLMMVIERDLADKTAKKVYVDDVRWIE